MSGCVARGRVLFASILLFVASLAAACSNTRSVEPTVAASASGEESVVSSGPEATVGVAATAGETTGSSGVPFTARTEASGGSSYKADTILAVRYGAHRGYERVVMDLGTGDEPAEAVPQWTLMNSADDGLLRVTLPSTSGTGVSNGKLGDALLESFHVVRAPEGGMFVDVFARKTFVYRVLELSNPARLVVDFKPGGEDLEVPPPAMGGNTVVVEPRAGARIEDPLTVCGYSRNFEASNTIILTDSDGKVVIRRTVLSNDWTSTWGYFETTMELPPFSGKGTLQVGANSARDGSFEGVEIPVRGG
jgi:Immunoglobulin-like domain of bacterial spore germination